MDNHQATTILIEAKTILDRLGIPFWLTDGTLLGVCRNNDFITHDSDIDLGVLIENHSEQIIQEFDRQGFSTLHMFGSIEVGLEYGFTKNGINLDIYFFYEEEDYLWCAAWYTPAYSVERQLLKCKYPKIRFQSIAFKEHEFYIPENTYAYLCCAYGHFWQIPEVNWDWRFSPKHIIDAPFLQISEAELKRNYHLVTQLYVELLSSVINQYHQNTLDEFILSTLQKSRKSQANFWLLQSDITIDRTYEGLMGIAYELLLDSGIKAVPALADEKIIINSINHSLAKSLYPETAVSLGDSYRLDGGWSADYASIKRFKEMGRLIDEGTFLQFTCYMFEFWLLQMLQKLMQIGRRVLPANIRHKLWVVFANRIYMQLFNSLKL